jgi:hypothetical protein
MANQWSAVSLETLLHRRAAVHHAYLDAVNSAVPLRAEMRRVPSFAQRLTETPTPEDFAAVPGLQRAYANEVTRTHNWNQYKTELTARLHQLSFADMIAWYTTAHAEDHFSTPTTTLRDAIVARMRSIFYDPTLHTLLRERRWSELAAYNLPQLLRDIQTWFDWRREHRALLYLAHEPEDVTILEHEYQIENAIAHIQGERDAALGLGTLPRTGEASLLRGLDPLLLREISEAARVPLDQPHAIVPSWSIWP